MVVTQWIMTLFAKGTPITLVFSIFDKFMKRKNPNYIFYLTCALFKIKTNTILNILDQEPDNLIIYMNKKMKDFRNENDIAELFTLAD